MAHPLFLLKVAESVMADSVVRNDGLGSPPKWTFSIIIEDSAGSLFTSKHPITSHFACKKHKIKLLVV